jgi:hypothetical protein
MNLVSKFNFNTPISNFIDTHEDLKKMDQLESNKIYRKKYYLILIENSNFMKYTDYLLAFKDKISLKFAMFDDYYLIDCKFLKKPKIKRKKFYPKHLNLDNNNLIVMMGKQNKNILKNIFFKDLISLPTDSILVDYFRMLLNGDFSINLKEKIEDLLSKNITEGSLNYLNEPSCSHYISHILRAISKYDTSNRSKIFSFELTMQLDAIRKCDCIYIHNSSLIIFEFKNNTMKGEDSLKYINDRDYVIHVCSFMKLFKLSYYEQIEKIMQIGIEFYGEKNDFKVQLKIGETISLVDLDSFINKKIETLSNIQNINMKKKRFRQREVITATNNNTKNKFSNSINQLKNRKEKKKYNVLGSSSYKKK